MRSQQSANARLLQLVDKLQNQLANSQAAVGRQSGRGATAAAGIVAAAEVDVTAVVVVKVLLWGWAVGSGRALGLAAGNAPEVLLAVTCTVFLCFAVVSFFGLFFDTFALANYAQALEPSGV